MRRDVLIAVSAVLVATSASIAPAAAFGDRCFYPGISVRGSVQGSMSAARSSSTSAWESRAARAHGRRYADWWYSGDREIDCSWDKSGRRFTCVAYAVACGRK